MVRTASALLRDGFVFVQGYSRTSTGLSIADGEVRKSPLNDLNAVGAGVLACLAEVREGLPHPSAAQWKDVQAPMLKAVGVKSWKTLAKGTKAVGVEWLGDAVKLTPTRGYAQSGGEALVADVVECPLNEAAIGEGLRRAFELSSS